MKKKIIVDIVAIISGIITGLFGAGAGLLLVPFLSLYLKLDEKQTRATTIFIIIFYSIVSLILYSQKMNIKWNIALMCIIGGSIGSLVGSKLLKKMSNKILMILFIIILIYSGIKFIR